MSAALQTDPVEKQISPRARAALTLLLLINLLNYVDRQILAAVEKPIGDQFHVGSDLTGWFVTAFMVAYIIFAPIFGFLADRMRRWAIVAVGVLVWSFASGATGIVPTFGLLIATRMLVGIGEAAYGPVAPTILADLYPPQIRGKMMAWFYAAIPIGSALGYVIGGISHAHWQWAFYATLPPGILLGIWCLFMPEPQRAMIERRRATRADYQNLLRIPSYLLATAGMAAMTFALGGIGYFMPRFLQEIGHQSPQYATPIFGGVVVISGLFATLLGGIVGDYARDRMPGGYFFVSAISMICGFPLIIAMLFVPFPACWIIIFLAVFCLFFNTGPSNTILANVTSPDVRATAFAINILVIHLLGDALSPPLIGKIAGHFGLRWGFAVVSVMVLLGGILWLCGMKFLASDTQAAAPRAI